MTQAVERILAEVKHLSADELAELTGHLVGNSVHPPPTDIEEAQLAEVHRRIARVEAGDSHLIPAEQVFDRGRALLASLAKVPQQR